MIHNRVFQYHDSCNSTYLDGASLSMGIRSTCSFWGTERGIHHSLPHSPAQALAGISLWKHMPLGHWRHTLPESSPKQKPWLSLFLWAAHSHWEELWHLGQAAPENQSCLWGVAALSWGSRRTSGADLPQEPGIQLRDELFLLPPFLPDFPLSVPGFRVGQS